MSEYTSINQFEIDYNTLYSTFATGHTKSIKWRKWQLKQLWWMLQDNESRFIDALKSDLNRHAFESLFSDLRGTRGDIIDMLENVDLWSKGEKPDAGFLMGTLSKAWLRKEPLGVVFIIGAFNFPIYTLLSPAVAAIAAGNCIILKPSELAPACSSLLVELVPKYLDQSSIKIVTGGAKETSQILTFKFNHIFYTGGSKVGRLIATAAAKHLTPTVLELGGQAPAIVCKSANIDLAAKRIAAAKLSNSGQICLNVNHIFVDPTIHDQLIERIIHWNKEFLKNGSDDFATIINERHFDRIIGLLKSTNGDVVYGGNTDRIKKYIQPTIVKDIKITDSLMSEEIFGPIAPILNANVENAIQTITSMPHPLGLYIFSNNQKEIDYILNNTTSGGVTINDIMMHAGVPHAPFGGVGESGYGSYHGKYGFDSFSHTRTIVSPPNWLEIIMSFRYPPYDIKNAKMVEIKSKLVGKRGETMEQQKIGKSINIISIITKVLILTTIISVVDQKIGGKLMIFETLKDIFRNKLMKDY